MRTFRWTLIWYGWCPYTKGKFGHRDTYRGETLWRDVERILPSTSQGERFGTSFPHSPQKESTLLIPSLILNFWHIDLWDKTFCYLNCLVCGALFRQPKHGCKQKYLPGLQKPGLPGILNMVLLCILVCRHQNLIWWTGLHGQVEQYWCRTFQDPFSSFISNMYFS